LLFDSIYEHFNFLQPATCFACSFVVKNSVVYTVQIKWCRLIWATLIPFLLLFSFTPSVDIMLENVPLTYTKLFFFTREFAGGGHNAHTAAWS